MVAHDSTNPHQFGKYMVTKENWDQGGESKWTTHRLYRQGATPYADAEHVGTMDIKHSAPDVYNLYPGPVGLTTPRSDSREMLHRGYGEKWATQQGTTRFDIETDKLHGKKPEIEGQVPMFLHSSTPAHTEVDTLIMSQDAKHMATTLLGMGVHEAMARGHHLQTPDSLSPHSQRMVGKLKEKGAVQEGHTFAPNNLDWAQPGAVGVPGGLEGWKSNLAHQRSMGETTERPVAVEKVRQGQATARSVIRRAKQPQFTQGTLF